MFASFSPDGTRVVTGATDNLARIWDANTGRMLTPPLPHPDWVSYVSLQPGRQVGRDGLQRWGGAVVERGHGRAGGETLPARASGRTLSSSARAGTAS